MGHKLLVVEDDDATATYIAKGMAEEGFVVDRAANGRDALFLASDGTYDAIVLDRMIPQMDGMSVLGALRAGGIETPVIVLSALGSTDDRVAGLTSGADDYLTKPFEPRELLARVRNLLRRSRVFDGAAGQGGQRPRVARFARLGPWRLDLHQRRLVTHDDRLVMLSSAEYRLLSRFIEAPNQVLSREELLPERSATVAFDRSIDIQISRLRHKLASEPGGDELILTVRSEGYVLPGPIAFE